MHEETIIPRGQLHLVFVIPVVIMVTVLAMFWDPIPREKRTKTTIGVEKREAYGIRPLPSKKTIRILTRGFPKPARSVPTLDRTPKRLAAVKEQQEICVECHLAEDEPEKEFEDGKEVLIGIDYEKFKATAHGKILACGACHLNYDSQFDAEGEHEYFEGTYAAFKAGAAKACANCHTDIQSSMKDSAHGHGHGMTCVSCHGSHETKLTHLKPEEVSTYCSSCHKDVVKDLTPETDVHSSALSKHKKDAASCIDCHGRGSVHALTNDEDRVDQNCRICHKSTNENFRISSHEGEVSCATCHGSHQTKRRTLARKDVTAFCTECHEDSVLGHDDVHQLAINRGNPQAPTCIDCHGQGSSHAVTNEPDLLSKTCSQCHIDEVRQLALSVHGTAAHLSCSTCHGSHDVKKMSLKPREVGAFCGRCHEDLVKEYSRNVHQIALDAGKDNSPNCITCHGAHTMQTVISPDEGWAHEFFVVECRKCHSSFCDIAEEHTELYRADVHLRDKLLCSDCHVPREGTRGHILEAGVLPKFRCERCHDKETILRDFTSQAKGWDLSMRNLLPETPYVVGADPVSLTDLIGLIIIAATFIGMPLGHGSLRFAARFFRKNSSTEEGK